MRYYEILPGLVIAWRGEEASESSSLSYLPPEYNHLYELMVCCRELTLEEKAHLERFRDIPFESISISDILEVSSPIDPSVHLYSPLLSTAVKRQGLASSLQFFPVRVFHREGGLFQPYEAVRYESSLYVSCLKPLTIYRPMGEREHYEFSGFRFEVDWTRCGHVVYKRRGSLLVLKKEPVEERVFFRVLNEKDAPLVVREDILEQWLEWGIEVDFQEVIVE